ncbi:protein FAM207A isoform X3 [Phocoena sinus]|uniref:protein FAM207A isoform X3 n=1 Tax=Phocoena sinus TaxID=42100 RepID=UPI0013C4B75B|nr:protein FAM207A isoform X3 [Phocoena sinus]
MPVKGRYTSLTSHTPPGAWVDRGQAECMHVLCTNNRWAVLSLSSLVGPPSRSPSSWPAPCLVSSPPFWVPCPPPSSPAPAPRGGRVATAPEGPVADFQPLGRETPRVGPPGPLADASLLASPGLCRLGCESVGCLSGRFRQFPWSKVCTQASELVFSTSHTVEIMHLKMEATRLAEQERKAEQRRRATVVVGDLQPLRDALPELLELQMGGQRRAAIRPRAAQLSRMSVAQRFQLLEEERTRFRELLASPAYRASPLQAIGRQLAQQMRLEGSGQS